MFLGSQTVRHTVINCSGEINDNSTEREEHNCLLLGATQLVNLIPAKENDL